VEKGGAASPTNCFRDNVIMAILFYAYQIYAIRVVAGSASRRFFPFSRQKIGLSNANIRGFRMVLGWQLV